jgi:sugar phosphate isomerase/epimerase
MNRRELLQLGTATLAATALAETASSQGAPAAAGPPAPRLTPSGKFPLDVYSRSLQWLRTPGDVAKAVTDIGLQTVDLTVMPYPGHVDPAKVKTDLPLFVNGLKMNGITVSAITCPITDADSPNAEAILGTASALGIRYYSWGGFRYDDRQAYQPQLDALKPRVSKLAKLNEKYGMRALYQPQAGAENVGAAFFDFLEVLRNFDPRFVSFRYDTGSLLQATPQTFVMQLRLGAPYIGGVALNDAAVTLDLPVWKDGPFEGRPEQLVGVNSSSGDNVGTDGGTPLAIGGGGRPLPYYLHPVPVGTGMIDLTLIGKTLKEINFHGPAECQTEWPLGGAEQGNDKITLPRQTVVGQIKHNRLMVEAAFASSWDLDIAQPAFLQRRAAGAGTPGAGRGLGGGRGAGGGRGPGNQPE